MVYCNVFSLPLFFTNFFPSSPLSCPSLSFTSPLVSFPTRFLPPSIPSRPPRSLLTSIPSPSPCLLYPPGCVLGMRNVSSLKLINVPLSLYVLVYIYCIYVYTGCLQNKCFSSPKLHGVLKLPETCISHRDGEKANF